MSLHLMECVRPLRLLPSAKLVMLAFADSADQQTQIAFPGIEAVMEWGNVSRSRASQIVSDLVDQGLLRKHHAGHRGRRSEYVVFPNGCCETHPRPGEETAPVSVEQLVAALGVDIDADGLAALQEVLDRHDGKGPARQTQSAEKGSGRQDSVSVEGSRPQDPSLNDEPERVLSAVPNTLKGSSKGPAHGTPSLTTTTFPQPHAEGVGSCPAHATPHPRCRGCGTAPRQLRDAARRDQAAADAQRRLDEQAARATASAPVVDRSAVRVLVDDTRRKIRGV